MSGILKSVLLFLLLFPGYDLLADDYVVSLDGVRVNSFIKGIYVDRVINASAEESCIGFVQTGMFNKQEAAMMLPSIAADVENCLKRSFPRAESLNPVIVRINRLYIYELTSSAREISCIDLSVTFISKDSSGYIELYTAGDSFEKSGLDVTGFHPGNIAAALGHCFDDLSKAAEYGKLHLKRISEKELFQNPLDNPGGFDVYKKTRISKGLFKSFYAFRDCHPDTVTSFTVKYQVPGKDSARMRASIKLSNELSQKDYYGFSDGTHLFIWAGSGFALANRRENSIMVTVEKKDAYDGATTGVYMAGIFGGMLGGLLGALATQATTASVNGPGNCTIDFSSGRLIPLNVPDYLKTESNTILFLSKASATDDGLTILHGADTLCVLIPGNYLRLILPSGYREIRIRMTGKGCNTSDETIPVRLFNTDVYLLRVKRNKDISVGLAYEQVRKDLLNRMTDENTVVRRSLVQQSPVN